MASQPLPPGEVGRRRPGEGVQSLHVIRCVTERPHPALIGRPLPGGEVLSLTSRMIRSHGRQTVGRPGNLPRSGERGYATATSLRHSVRRIARTQAPTARR